MKSTLPILAATHKKVTFDNGITQPLDGFSEKGVDRIIALSAQLNLDYGTFEK
ncbi:MAG: hypothetical protein ACI8ZM_004133 [Crocinitomix sp.]|jgi:hypothetical protein